MPTDSSGHTKNSSPSPENSTDPERFPIVALGASAGGLESLEAFFTELSPETGLSFVIITHLAPDHKTLMPEILSKYTRMKVQSAEEGMAVEPNQVYLIPPNATMTIRQGRLHLEKPQQPRGRRQPVDHFFDSLAKDRKEQAYAVVLSGAGSDGSAGVRSIKEYGGVVIAEDDSTSRYNSMPQSAILTGQVDFILPVEQIPGILKQLAASPLTTKKKSDLREQIGEVLPNICALLKQDGAPDFNNYKNNTLIRRVERRMVISSCAGIDEYLERLIQDPGERLALYKDLLIGVTTFFRDPEAFELLREKILVPLVEEQKEDSEIRIWVPGCSTGEEAYTLAMLIYDELLVQKKKKVRVQIFGTDMDEKSIARARKGRYNSALVKDVPEKFLEKYFRQEENSYRLVREIRELVVFAPHNLLSDPPFSQMDLVSCRNLLIYLEQEIQSRLIPLFHHALRPKGALLLGPSETVGTGRELFETLDKRWKLYRAKPATQRLPKGISLKITEDAPLIQHHLSGAESAPKHSPAKTGESLLFSRYIPPSVIINDQNEILHAYNRLTPYLEQPVGESTLNILKMAARELRPILRAAIHQAFSEERSCLYKEVRFSEGGEQKLVNLRVEPLKEPPSAKGLAVVTFEPVVQALETGRDSGTMDVEVVRHLEDQLRATTEQLHANLGESERNEEELKSSNEELMSMNEELQSANEELETSKEELQALNEELITVNAELQSKLDELSEANNDIQNLMVSSQLATVFLDKQLRIKRFTPAVAELFNLIDGDLGRPIKHISSNIDYPELERDAKKVLRNLEPIEREIHCPPEGYFLLRVLPYRTLEDVIEGVVLSFVDVSRRREAERARRLSEERLRMAVRATREAIWDWDLAKKHIDWNDAYEQQFGRPRETDSSIDWWIEHIHPEDRDRVVKSLKEAVRSEAKTWESEYRFLRKDGIWADIFDRAYLSRDASGKTRRVVGSMLDITERKQFEQSLKENEERLKLALAAGDMGTWDWDVESHRLFWSDGHYTLLGLSPGEVEPSLELWKKRLHPEDRDRVVSATFRAMETGEEYRCDYRVIHPDGSVHWVEARGFFTYGDNKTPLRMHGVLSDISERRQREETLARARDEAEQANRIKSEFLANMSHEIRTPITVTLASLEFLEDSGLEGKNRQAVDMARTATNSLLRLINDILDFAKIDAGTLAIYEDPFDLKLCLHKVLKSFNFQLGLKNLDLQIDLPEDVPAIVIGDEDRFQQILSNLVGNAVKFTEQGKISIAIRTTGEISKGRGVLECSVSDTGIGIPADKLDSLFEDFTQVDGSITRQYGGAGLGLAICKRLLDLMNGSIDVQSKTGEGSTFRFCLPMAPITQLPDSERGETETAGTVPAELPVLRILLVEDEPMVSKMVGMLLEEQGWEVTVAENGRVGAERFEPGRFDVVLMDIQMPEMNGYEATRAIREKESRSAKHTPIIALSAHVRNSDRQKALEAGMDEHVAKPVKRSTLIATILARASSN